MDQERVMDLLKELARPSANIEALITEARAILAEHFSEEGHLERPPSICPVCGSLYIRTRTVYGSTIVECGICDYQDSW